MIYSLLDVYVHVIPANPKSFKAVIAYQICMCWEIDFFAYANVHATIRLSVQQPANRAAPELEIRPYEIILLK